MSKPFAAYRGAELYYFVCYAHKDSDNVYADLSLLNEKGIKLWYDEGIPAGSSWRAEIAGAIEGCSKLLFFISEASLTSSHCLREVDFAVNHDIDIVPVYLDDSVLPAELELVLNRVHALFRERDTMYMEHLLGALQVGGNPIIPHMSKAKKRKYNTSLVLFSIFLAAVSIFAWSPWKSLQQSRSGDTSVAAPSGYSSYLEGLKLIERWDKGDNLNIAIEKFEESVSLDPDFALGHARLAEALRIQYALTGDQAWLDSAVNHVNTAVALNPGLGPVQVALSRVHREGGNFDLALAAAEEALLIDPFDAQANAEMGILYAKLGRPDDAEKAFKTALSLDPERISSLSDYAHFLDGQGRSEAAIQQWQEVTRIAPDHYAALVNLGGLLSDSSKTAEAISIYQRSIEIRPSPMAWSNLGTSYMRAQQFTEAVSAYQNALELDDSDWLVWGNLGYTYSFMKNAPDKAAAAFARAIELAEIAREKNPRDAWASSDLGLYYAKTGKTKTALQRTGSAMTLSPENGEIFAAAAEVYELTGDRDSAVNFASQAMELGYPRSQFLRNPETADLMSDARLQN